MSPDHKIRFPTPPPAMHGRINWVEAGALTTTVAMLVIAASVFSDEWTIRQARAIGTMQQAGISDFHIPSTWNDEQPDGVPARALLVRAQIFARSAFTLQHGIARKERLALAQKTLNAAMTARPLWGEAKIVQAFIDLLAHGQDAMVTRDALKQSYELVRFSSDSGIWRVRLGIAEWQQIDPGLRQHVIEEAVWLGNQSPILDSLMRSILMGVPSTLADYWSARKYYDFSKRR